MEDKIEQTTPDTLGLIQIADGVYCKLNKVVADVDIVDAFGNPLENDGVKQAPHSRVELSGEELAGLELPIQSIANKIYLAE